MERVEAAGGAAGRRRRVGSRSAEEQRRLLADWEASGLTQVEFCRQRGVNANSFKNWKHQLAKRTEATPPPKERRGTRRKKQAALLSRDFTPIHVSTSTAPGAWWLELQLLGGRVLRLASALPAAEVAALAAALEQ
jgi:hypothetical protein